MRFCVMYGKKKKKKEMKVILPYYLSVKVNSVNLFYIIDSTKVTCKFDSPIFKLIIQ